MKYDPYRGPAYLIIVVHPTSAMHSDGCSVASSKKPLEFVTRFTAKLEMNYRKTFTVGTVVL